MTAQFWLYYGSATAFLLAVLAVVDILGHRIVVAYRRYQVRKECLKQMRELIKLAPKAPWMVEDDEASMYLPPEQVKYYQQQMNQATSSMIENLAKVRKEFK